MNLKIAIAVDQNGGAFSRSETVNRPRPRHRRHLPRRRRRLRYRLRNRSGCPSYRRQPNYPRQDDSRRTRQGSSYRRRRNCRHRWSCRRVIGDCAAALQARHQGVADQGHAADRNSKCRPRARHGALSRRNAGRGAQLCNAQTPQLSPLRRQMWRPRSLIIQAKYGTLAATDGFSAVPAH
jgi:hypothetical protein